MRKFISAASLIILHSVLLLTFQQSALSQRRQPSRPAPAPAPATQRQEVNRRATVFLKEGDPVAGLFISADSDSLQLEVAGNRLSIKLNQVARIEFVASGVATTTQPTPVPSSTLSIEAGLVFRSGDTKPVSRATFHLLDEDAAKILSVAGLKPDDEQLRISKDIGQALIDTYAISARYGDTLEKYRAFYPAATQALQPHILKTVTTDFSGKAAFEDVAPGTYYVMGWSQTPRGYVIWNLKVEVRAGQNSLLLDQNNAVTAM